MTRTKRLLFIVITLPIVLAYQNCSKNSFDTSEESSNSGSIINWNTLEPVSPETSRALGLPIVEKLNASQYRIDGNENWILDRNCKNNSDYDACVFWKNPVAQRYLISADKIQSPFFPRFNYNSNTESIQTLAIKLTNRANLEELKSPSLDVFYTGINFSATRMKLTNGKSKTPYFFDRQFETPQLMAYYWLTYLETTLLNRANQFFTKDKGILIDVFSLEAGQNAYYINSHPLFSGKPALVFGYIGASPNTPDYLFSVNAEILIHEMGHAQLDFAAGSADEGVRYNENCLMKDNSQNRYEVIRCDQSSTFGSASLVMYGCTTKQGCLSAIHEGIADFTAGMIFSKMTAVGETVANKTEGINSLNISRDVKSVSSLTIDDIFQGSAMKFGLPGVETFYGEPHALGSAYASILWEIYSDSRVDKIRFEKIFLEHLTTITTSSTFKTGRESLITADALVPGTSIRDLILEKFNQRGVAP